MRGFKRRLAANGIQVLLQLNDGNFCEGVYLCKNKNNENTALKIVSTKNKAIVKCIENEYTVLQSIKHENIIMPKRSLFRIKNYVAMEMELVSGHDLCVLLIAAKDDQTISYEGFQHVIFCLLLAVEYLHENGIYHNDLKPDNLLVDAKTIEQIDSTTKVKLCDFGLSRLDGVTYDGPRGGSPNWAAPELFTCKAGDNYKSELWSLGCIVFCIATKSTPFPFLETLFKSAKMPKSINEFYNKIRTETNYYHTLTCGYLEREEVRTVQNSFLQIDPINRLDIPTVMSQSFFVNKASPDT